ncbi:MAG: hypothetical protein OXM55_04990 [Bdellovibrionales bacterium]|nr:hypothetical protein [Bdellovibrionales bacterium]
MRYFKYCLPTLFLICHFISIANETKTEAVSHSEEKANPASIFPLEGRQNDTSFNDERMKEELLILLRSTDIPIRRRIHILPILKQFKPISVPTQQAVMAMFFEATTTKGKKAILKFFGEIRSTDITVIEQLAEFANSQKNPIALRILAIQAIGKTKTTDESTQLILVRLSVYSRYKALRRIAKLILKRISLSQKATQHLAAIANSDTSTTPQRIIAIWNLKYAGPDQIAVPLLGEVASNKQNPEDARMAAIQAMRNTSHYQAARQLLNIYNMDSNSHSIRQAAYEVLEESFSYYLHPSPKRCHIGFRLTPL